MELRKQKEDVKLKYDSFIQKSDFDKASKILYEDMPNLEHEILDLETKINSKENSLIHDSITANDVSEVISKATGIPLEKIVENQKSKLLNLANDLKTRVKGQDHAIDVVANAVLRGRAGINDPNRPIGSFLFMGPTGIGKTELAKALAYYMFDSEKAIVRFDMSEFMEKFTVSRLVGAPPGYVGYEEGGQLTEKVRRRPYSVVLLDEIEKAHSDVFNMLLQVMDEGRLTDSLGRKVDFKNTIIIMTSNIGSREVKDFNGGIGFNSIETSRNYSEGLIRKALNRQFSPEFLNRIDDIIMFEQLDKEAMKEIIDIELSSFFKRTQELGYTLKITDEVKSFLIDKGYDKNFGARPLKRAIQTYIEDTLADYMLRDNSQDNTTIELRVDRENDSIEVVAIDENKVLNPTK